MKILLVLGGMFLALVLAAYLVAAHFLGTIVVKGVNTLGPKLTQTKVELASASLSPFSGSGSLTGLSVGNPKGWSEGRAFYLGKVQVDVQPWSLLGDPIVINEIIIDQPEFAYETTIVSSNIKELLKTIRGYSGGSDPGPAAPGGKSRKFILKKFRLTNGKAAVMAGGNSLLATFPPVSLDNLGVAEGGITGDQLASALMSQVLSNIAKGATEALGKSGSSGTMNMEQVKGAVKNAGDALKKMFEKK